MRTAEKLEQLTDPGEFEVLAVRALRALYDDCKAVAHLGVNPSGKTTKSPLDGFVQVPDSNPPRYVMVAITTTGRAHLRRKWLFDHNAAACGGEGTPADDGDLPKAGREAASLRAQEPIAAFELYLCTNRGLDAELMTAVYADAKDRKIQVQFLEQSVLRDFLDTTAEGQWLRQEHLGISADRVSRPLLQALGRKSLENYERETLLATADEIVSTQSTDRLAAAIQSTRVSLHVLVGPSGSGKSVASQAVVRRELARNGSALHITSQVAENANTLHEAIRETLASLHARIGPTAGEDTLALASATTPLVLVVDDINRTTDPVRLLRKLLYWSRPTGTDDSASTTVRVICPVWEAHWLTIRESTKSFTWVQPHAINKMRREEAIACLQAGLHDDAGRFTAHDLDGLAIRMNDDPILLGMFGHLQRRDPSANPQAVADDVVARFVADTIATTAVKQNRPAADYHTALARLATELLRRRTLYPRWRDAQDWFCDEPSTADRLAAVAEAGHILHVTNRSGDDYLEFRHDRLRDHHLTRAAVALLEQGNAYREIVADPFFVPIVGGALADTSLPGEALDWTRCKVPNALLAAIAYLPTKTGPHDERILALAGDWLKEIDRAPEAIRHDAFQLLAATDSVHVLPVTEGIDKTFLILEARLRNGDARAGATFLAHHFYPASHAPWLESLIAQGVSRDTKRFVSDLSEILTADDTDDHLRFGALCLAGYLAEPALAVAILPAWQRNPVQGLLPAALWAALRCAAPDPSTILQPLLHEVLKLSSDETGQSIGDRESVLMEIRLAGHHGFAENVLSYLAELGNTVDEYTWPVVSIFSTLNHPCAIQYLLPRLAEAKHNAEKAGGFWPFADIWLSQRASSSTGSEHLSSASLARVRDLWQGPTEPPWVRTFAFSVWAPYAGLADLKAISADSEHFNVAMLERATRGDDGVSEPLAAQLSTHPHWYRAATPIWNITFEVVLDSDLAKRGRDPDHHTWSNLTFSLAEALRDIPRSSAERLLMRHWPTLKHIPLFIQAALYHDGQCRALAREILDGQDAPHDSLRHVDHFFGFMTTGLQDRLSQHHLDALQPYLSRLEDMPLITMATWCSRNGQFGWAGKHLGPECRRRAQAEATNPAAKQSVMVRSAPYWFATDEELLAGLDAIEHEEPYLQHFALRRWREQVHSDDSRRAVALLEQWLDRAPSVARLVILGVAVQDEGTRADVQRISTYAPALLPGDATATILSNIAYAVQRRTLE